MKNVLIMRGLPGCGKSTYTRKQMQVLNAIGKSIVVASADDFFVVNNMKFDPHLLPMAHECCYEIFLEALNASVNCVIVDNTNTGESEFSRYYDAALERGYVPTVVEFSCDVQTSFERNLHKVPRKTIEKMFARLNQPLSRTYNIVKQ